MISQIHSTTSTDEKICYQTCLYFDQIKRCFYHQIKVSPDYVCEQAQSHELTPPSPENA